MAIPMPGPLRFGSGGCQPYLLGPAFGRLRAQECVATQRSSAARAAQAPPLSH